MVLIGNGAQDRDFGCRNCGFACRPDSVVRSNLHHFGHANPKSVSAWLLCEQNLLREFKEEHRAGFAAAFKERVWIRAECDVRCSSLRDRAGPDIV